MEPKGLLAVVYFYTDPELCYKNRLELSNIQVLSLMDLLFTDQQNWNISIFKTR